jgi:hypothetical protein
MKTVSIGYLYDYGREFAILATLNNSDRNMREEEFNALVNAVKAYIELMTKRDIVVLERQDTPECVAIE